MLQVSPPGYKSEPEYTSLCKETLSIVTYAKSTITYNLKRVPLVLFITSKKLEKTNT